MQRRFLSAVLVAMVLGAAAPTALAQGAAPEAADLAKDRFQKGAQAYSEHRYKDAIDHFLEANRVAPNPAFAYNIGLAYEDLGDPDNALMWYRQYLRDLPDAQDKKEVQARVAAAESRLRARGVQQVTIISTPPAATVIIDGERVGVTPWTGQIKPGHHKVEAELPDYQRASDMMDLPSDHAIDFKLTLKKGSAPAPAAGPSPAGTPPPAPVEPSQSSSGGVHWYTWGALGLGAAGLTTALIFELARGGAIDDARHASTNPEGKDLYDRAKTDQTMSRIAVIAGSAFLASGAVLLYVDLSSTKAGPEARAGLGCGASTCGVTVHGRF